MMRGTLDRHLIPHFGERPVNAIGKADVLQYRAELAKSRGRNGNEVLSPKTINHYVGILKAILAEAADRYQFTDPAKRVTRLKVPRKDIEPFTIDEIRLMLANIRVDYRHYLTVRAFTGMRTGEVHGLKWKNVDFGRQQILVRETSSKGRTEYTKNDGSQREIDMSPMVIAALKEQAKETQGQSDYVFCDRDGGPLDAHNVTNRVWYPLLRYLGLRPRRPYQLRHTCATLWLGAGENPEWIARQLGHTTTEMLFRVYSRYIPNLTRKDGSAFNRLVADALHQTNEPTTSNEAI
jgi:integrase